MDSDKQTKKPYEKPRIKIEEIGAQELLCHTYGSTDLYGGYGWWDWWKKFFGDS